MGVHGLWRLIEPSGKPVPLETLENKVLAVDVSIWLHQAIKGFQDAKGSSVPNAHLLAVYNRICKLLYYRIRPVFVFDGGVPALKKQTIAKRQQNKNKHEEEAIRLRQQILTTLLKQTAINTVLLDQIHPPIKTSPLKGTRQDEEDLFKLPDLPEKLDSSIEESEDCSYTSSEDSSSYRHMIDIESVDEKSEQFRSLPADVRHDILTEIKENSKLASRRKLLEMDATSGDFSKFQIKRVLKRRSIQVSLEEAEKEMGGHSLSLGELEALLNEEGIVTSSRSVAKSRIASDEKTRYLLIKDLQKSVAIARNQIENEIKLDPIPEDVTDVDDIENLVEEESSDICTPCSNSHIGNKENNVIKDDYLDTDAVSTSSKIVELATKEILQPSTSFAQKEIGKNHELELNSIDLLQPSTSSKINSNTEFEQDLKTAIALSLEDTSNAHEEDLQSFSYLENFKDGDFISDSSSDEETVCNPTAKGSTSLARKYLTEYTDFTPAEIQKILGEKPEQDVEGKDFYFNEMRLTSPNSINKFQPNTTNDKNPVRQLFTANTGENKESSEQIEIISDKDSDSSDDFIEVDNTPITNSSTIIKQVPLQIVIDTKSHIADDMFADLFDQNVSKETQINDSLQSNEMKKTDESNITTHKEILEQNIDDKSIPNSSVEEKICDQSLSIPNKTEINTQAATDEMSTDKAKITESVDDLSTGTSPTTSVSLSQTEVQTKLSQKELSVIKDSLEVEQNLLLKEKAHEDRMANSITDTMYKDTQELLELFGVPYITAPMEAEAQCAYLDDIKLIDGTITDDSDIWLFGGQTVYKNFFSHKKHVLEFKAENIQHHFKLSRYQLILLALLVGSDYTIGIQGVGPVTALEILAAFPASKEDNVISQDQLVSNLAHFRNWWQTGRAVGPAKTSLRNKLKNITFNDGFPNQQVALAYLKPEIDLSKEMFSWGKPNISLLRSYARIKFGWSELKTNEILLPVMKKLQDPNSQKTILAYYQKQPVLCREPQLSKRVTKAIARIDRTTSDQLTSDEESPPKKLKKPNVLLKTKTLPAKNKDAHDKEENSGIKKAKMTKNKRKNIKEPQVTTVDIDLKPLSKIAAKVRAASMARISQEKSREIIPQRERDKINALNTKLKAIEIYRKSKQGPGFVQKRTKIKPSLKEDAELSDSSSD